MNVQNRKDFELTKAHIAQITFIFLEYKICFALKQIQRLNKKFYCAQITITPPKKCSIWSYKKHILAQKMGTTVYLVFQDIDRDLAQFWQKGELTLVNGSISSTAVLQHSKIQCMAVFLEKNRLLCIQHSKLPCTAVFFFLEKDRLPCIQHCKIQYTTVFLEKNRLSCIQYFKYSTRLSCIQTRRTTFPM